jgi:hypothetical protein
VTIDLSIRKGEIEAIQAYLADAGIETSDKEASALLKVAMQAVLDRDWWLVIAKDLHLGYGLYATENAAIKAATDNTLGIFGGVVVRAFPYTKRVDYIKEQA